MTRIWVEEANGLNSQGLGGHRYLDMTDKPCSCIQASRPIRFYTIQTTQEPPPP